MTEFERALAIVLRWEGGYVDHPRDPGGATHLGITRATLAQWRGAPVSKADVKALTHREAAAIYETRYWTACRCGALAWPAALLTFDGAVNHGPGRAARLLQAALSVDQDGVIGPVTLAAAGVADPRALAEEIAARRMRVYGGLNHFTAFGLGWSRRLMNVLAEAVTA